MAARSASPSLGTFFAPRTVFVRASPVPLTFSERRAVLHALKKHCRIDFFKKIKNNPSSFLSLAESEEAARTLIAKSPLKYQLAIDAADPDARSTPLDGNLDSKTPRTGGDLPTTSSRDAASAKQPSGATKQFVIHIFPQRGGKTLAEMVQSSRLFGPWPAAPDMTSFATRHLRRSIPGDDGAALRDGLADWETGDQLVEDGDVFVDLDRAGTGARNDAKRYVEKRKQRRESRLAWSGLFKDTQRDTQRGDPLSPS
ncbi:uncharacterized protein DNG_00822 [Cephalotrichum gorgonifer]|uniref:Uncharacterized protein n=1 Tax=Cephalotrichum gorgonifer TaxID=2041049 RepID=A0AAE8MPT4_9PEZI|nr:uncharacterized protein DNG_00822 [Cephalotrichum gorgonifer]